MIPKLIPPVDPASMQTRMLMGKLRTVWKLCCRERQGDAKRRAEPPRRADRDDQTEWGEEEIDVAVKPVKACYGGLVLPPSAIPNMQIMRQVDVKLCDRPAEPVLLTKLKNQEDYALIIQRPPRETPIADGDRNDGSLHAGGHTTHARL